MTTRILVVDDEKTVTEVVERYLRHEGFDVSLAADGAEGLRVAEDWAPDLVVLDLMLPVVDGLEVCRRLRRETDTPIIMLTARGEETDRVVGLELGADDYVVKPFSPRELVARIKFVLRRTAARPATAPGGTIRFGNLTPIFPIWLNIPLSKSSAFFKPLSICETLAVGMAIITP